MQEGDVILFTGTLVSGAIAMCSRGYSHAGLLLNVDGSLYVAHSTPNPTLAPSISGVTHSGVQVTPLTGMLNSGFYVRAKVVRPPHTFSTLRACREYVADTYGIPYESNPCAIPAARCGCECGNELSQFCSEFVARALAVAHVACTPGDFDDLPFVAEPSLPPASWRWLFHCGAAPSLPPGAVLGLRAAVRHRLLPLVSPQIMRL